MSETICAVCDQAYRWAWTDTHGVAQCVTCGAPYRLYHYEHDARVELPPSCLFAEQAPFWRRCWSETGQRFSAGWLGLSFGGGYDIASPANRQAVHAWWLANKTAPDAPKPAEEAR
jgi:hypothetical protein